MSKPTINTFIESYTPPLPLFKVQGKPQVTLELKPYIQPFERVLAKAELAGLLGLKVSLETEAKPYVTLYSDTVPVKTLQRRLAYWQRIGDDVLEPTLQARYEATAERKNGLFDDSITDVPKIRRLRYGPHGIHEYRGKFFPQLVKALINFAGLPEGATVLDPMCGSGTTICEARAMGMKSIGVDLNPLSIEISQLKADLLSITPEQLQSALEQPIEALKQASVPDLERFWGKHDLDYLLRWFDPRALDEIAVIRTVIASIENLTVRKMAEIGLSNILRSISWQSDTDLRVRKKVTAYTEGTASQAFTEEIRGQREKLFPYLSLLQDGGYRTHYELIAGDARYLDSLLPTYVGTCDVIITSPPYATALPYIDTDRLSLIVLGLLPRQERRARECQLIGNSSYQDGDTRYTRINRPYQPGEVKKRFTAKLTDAISRARKIIDCPKAESTLYLDDSRNLSKIQSESVSLIVTSPPYLNAYDYHKYHRQHLHWIEGNIKLARDCEIGKHDMFTRPKAIPDPYFDDMEKCFAEWARVLCPNGRAFIVIGDAIVNGQPIPVADGFLEILTRVGFQCEKQWIRQIPESKKSFNRHNSRINEEHLLLFQRK